MLDPDFAIQDTPRRVAPASSSPPAVSVIVPTYNRVDLLAQSLQSVASQAFRDYEIIVVDDGSDDGTREYLASCPQRVHYLWQENQGVAEARNHALRVTRSEFVAFLDSDDLWKPPFLERAVNRLREHPEEALVFADFVSTDPSGNLLRGHRKEPHAGDITAQLFASTFIHTSAVVARSAIIRDAGGFDGRLTHNEDYDLWLRLSLRHRFGLIPEPLCLRRCHRESLSRNGCSPEVLLHKATLLHQFFESNGKGRIPERLARRRLGKLYYTAAKAYLRAGRADEAHDILHQSMQIDRPRTKPWLWLLYAEASRAVHALHPKPVQATHSKQ